jgi:hypothetical protein
VTELPTTRFLLEAEWTGDRWRFMEATAQQVCECGHLLADHAPSLKCRTCGGACGVDASVMFGRPPAKHLGNHDVAELVRDQLAEICAAARRIEDHADALGQPDCDDMPERITVDAVAVLAAVDEIGRLTEVLG